MTLPFNYKNSDASLASMKIGTHKFFSDNNELMDLIVVDENQNEKKKDHAAIADASLEINLSED
jgi:hypothetical protein